MSPEPTGVHGLLKQRKLFTHKNIFISFKIYASDLTLLVPKHCISNQNRKRSALHTSMYKYTIPFYMNAMVILPNTQKNRTNTCKTAKIILLYYSNI